jgi:hypothetical protein
LVEWNNNESDDEGQYECRGNDIDGKAVLASQGQIATCSQQQPGYEAVEYSIADSRHHGLVANGSADVLCGVHIASLVTRISIEGDYAAAGLYLTGQKRSY